MGDMGLGFGWGSILLFGVYCQIWWSDLR